MIESSGRNILRPLLIWPENIFKYVAASMYFARSEDLFTSINVIVLASLTLTQSASVSIFAASARVTESFGRNLVLSRIIPFERARETYRAYQMLVETSLNGILRFTVGTIHPVVLMTILRNSARVRFASGL